MQSPFKFACGVVLGIGLALAGRVAVTQAQEEQPADTEQQAAKDAKPAADGDEYFDLMRVFVDTFQEIDRNYVKEVDRRQLVEAAVRGMLSELDPYSNYIPPDDLEQFTEAISQEFGGVGIRVEFDQDQRLIKIVSPLPGSPAYEAGIHAGDRIVEIEGKSVKEFKSGEELETAISMLRGKAGEEVTIGIQRAGSDAKEPEKITLIRDMIQLDTVRGYASDKDFHWDYMLDPEEKIGYLRLTHFTGRSAAEVREVVKKLKKDGMRGLILDLRFNPGGLLQSALEISDLFIEDGLIVSTKGRNTIPRDWPAKKFGTYTGFPVAVIINRYSASASEIVSACLQDHNRAIVVGERSWGKGSVQDVIDLEDGKSALKLTTASYHRPSGKNIHRFPDSKETDEWGVSPNEGYKVEFTPEELEKYQRARVERDRPGVEYTGDFVDTQLEAARRAIQEQLKATGTASEPETKDDDAAPAVEEKKAASGPRFLMVPKVPVG